MMKLLIISTAVVIFIYTTAVKSADEWLDDTLSSLDGRIVYLQHQWRKGYWTYGYFEDPEISARMLIRSKGQILEDPIFKWKVHYLGESKIALENMAPEHSNTYISRRWWSNGKMRLQITSDPSSDPYVQIMPKDPQIHSCGHSKTLSAKLPFAPNYSSFLGVSKIDHTTLSNVPQVWNIFIPDASDQWVIVSSFDNRFQAKEATFDFIATIGVEMANARIMSESTKTTLGVELSEAFKPLRSGDVKETSYWEKQSSQTWSKPVSTTIQTTVPAGKRIELRQLIGHYNSNKVLIKSSLFRFVDLDSNEAVTQDISELSHYADTEKDISKF